MERNAEHGGGAITSLETPSLRRPVISNVNDDDAAMIAREAAALAFACAYCPRRFFSPQALGGHQNTHRLQRNRHFAASASSSLPVRWLRGGRQAAAAAAASVVYFTWAPDHDHVVSEVAAAVPETMDLTLKL